MDGSYLLGCRLLPLIIEHTIDERSPLIGHTFDSLMAVCPRQSLQHALRCLMAAGLSLHWERAFALKLVAVQANAEIIVTFEGTTEFGNPFMARQSYLPTEIHWGHKFV